ncbi:MAG: cellulase family glycosylhydrolase [Bacteroidales bacterium]
MFATGYKLIIVICLSLLWYNLLAQPKIDQVTIDDNGIMRWSADGAEIHGFGVNYTLPFAHEYRMAVKSGVSVEKAIEQDVYHMARLDCDLFRVHVWDTEISDTMGNLIQNEHLRLFDFAVSEMKKRGMRFIITPIAYWGNGWPEPDEVTPGFSHKYGKEACLTNPEAIKAQANYLNQFLKHINTYTGLAYKDDPQVIAFEISNEPHHSGPDKEVTSFINTMVSAVRSTGCTKPVFYNMSHSIHLADAYLKADIQGGTFQWYPTGLVAGHEVSGNFLPHVATYSIPFADDPRFRKMAKIIYEFDPADAAGNIMYPAMALTFRETGMQMAAQFAYDALCRAPFNTNYGTHFMNLAYAPKKALSLKIASAVFHEVPMYHKYPDKNNFDGFHISYTDDLAEWVSDEKFFYSDNTSSQPANASLLKEIAGCGTSPLVQYSGNGAYFIDKVDDGCWRLEVMPDYCWIEDPYSPVSPDRQKAAVIHNMQQMTITLPDLGSEFLIRGINKGNNFSASAINGGFKFMPGTYLLLRKELDAAKYIGLVYKNIRVNEYVAPATNLEVTILRNLSPAEATAGMPLVLLFEATSPQPIRKIEVALSNGSINITTTAFQTGTNSFKAEVPADMTTKGFLNYQVIIDNPVETRSFPGGYKGKPWSWENRDMGAYRIRLVSEKSPLLIWEAEQDWDFSYKEWNRFVELMPDEYGETILTVNPAYQARSDRDNTDPAHIEAQYYAFKFFFGKKVAGRTAELHRKQQLAVNAENPSASTQVLEIGLIDQKGVTRAGEVLVRPGEQILRIPLHTLKPAPLLILPRPYPEFLPREVPPADEAIDWSSVEMLQVKIKSGGDYGIHLNIGKIWLE